MELPTPAQINMAAADPQVPGAGPSVPMPKKVATRKAQSAGRPVSALPASAFGISVFVVKMPMLRVFHFVGNVFHRRCYDVLTARPLAQIDKPAAFAAKGQIFIAGRDSLFANGALQFDFAFFVHVSL
jgi:hypothetical protein